MEPPAENDTLMVDLTRVGARDRTDVARPAPSGLQVEPPNCSLVMGYGLDSTVGKPPDLFWIAKTLCLGTRHNFSRRLQGQSVGSIRAPLAEVQGRLAPTGKPFINSSGLGYATRPRQRRTLRATGPRGH